MLLVHLPRKLLLKCFNKKRQNPSKNNVLLINLLGIGDAIISTATLDCYKKYYSETTLLLYKECAIGQFIEPYYVDNVIYINSKKFNKNPFYGFKIINQLRMCGFNTIINITAAPTIESLFIAKETGAQKIFSYEGSKVRNEVPLDLRDLISYKIRQRIQKTINIIPNTIEKNVWETKHMLDHYESIYRGVTKDKTTMNLFPKLNIDSKELEVTLKKFNLKKGEYCFLGIEASLRQKQWPIENFVFIANNISKQNIYSVIIGSRKIKNKKDLFNNKKIINLVGKTTLEESIYILAGSLFYFGNDTGFIHAGIAIKKPSICILGNGNGELFGFYGDKRANLWLFKKTNCFLDNWRCSIGIKENDSCPCIKIITKTTALDAIKRVFNYINNKEDRYTLQKWRYIEN